MRSHADLHRSALRAADGAFRRLRFDQPVEASVLCRLSAAWAAYLAAYEAQEADRLPAVGDLRQQLLQLAGMADPPTPDAADPARSAARPVAPDRPLMGPRPAARPHGLPWLPAVADTNLAPLRLYVWTSVPPEHLAHHGLPTAEMFLLGHLDATRLAARQHAGYLAELRVDPGIAIDPLTYAQRLPSRLQHRMRDVSDAYLLPLAWLDRVSLTGAYEVSAAGGQAAGGPRIHAALTVCFRGADHGVPGLPNDVVRWPVRRPHEAYVTLPKDPQWISARWDAYPGWLPLSRHRPNIPPGYRLLRVEVERRGAIDLPATLAGLVHAPIAAASRGRFAGVDLALRAGDFESTMITSASGEADHGLIGAPLSRALPDAATPAMNPPASAGAAITLAP